MQDGGVGFRPTGIKAFRRQYPEGKNYAVARDVDLDRGFIHIRDPKGGVDQIIPLSDAAHDLLSNHPEVEKNPHVFTGDQ